MSIFAFIIVDKSANISVSGQTCGQRRKMGLFNPQSREEQAHCIYHESERFREDFRENKRKSEVRLNLRFWSEWRDLNPRPLPPQLTWSVLSCALRAFIPFPLQDTCSPSFFRPLFPRVPCSSIGSTARSNILTRCTAHSILRRESRAVHTRARISNASFGLTGRD